MLQLCLLLLCSFGFAQINTQITPYYACDDDNDQAATFDLTTKIPEILGSLNPNDYTVTFWESGSVDFINNPSNYIGNWPVSLVHAKVVNNTTQQLTTISLSLYTLVIPNYQPQVMHSCDYTGVGIAEFNLHSQAYYFNYPTNSGPIYPSLTTSFFISNADAQANINPIQNLIYNNTTPYLQTIYARVSAQSCFKIVPVTLTVNTCTQAGNPQNMIACPDSSGLACFDLTVNTPVVLGSYDPLNYTVTYHQTQAAAETNASPLPVSTPYCVSAITTVYARLTHNVSGEYDIAPITLTPSQILIDTAQPIATLTRCDDNADLSVVFDLSALTAGGATLYTSQENAIAGTSPITNASAYIVGVAVTSVDIFIRIPEGPFCATIKKATLSTFPDCNNAYQCPNAHSLCASIGYPFANITNTGQAGPPNSFGCLGSTPNPSWFYLPVGVGGNLSYTISQVTTNALPIDVDFICYGPFNSLTDGCANLTPANVFACSYSPAPVETFTIPNAQAGKYYLLMVTNFSNQAGFITINETSQNQGALSCAGLRMQAFLDLNSNGVKDAGENDFALGNFTYEANNNGTTHTITDADGFYSLYDENLANNYDIAFNVFPQYTAYYNVTTPSYTNVAVQPGNLIQTYYFPVTVTQSYNDLAVHVIGNTPPRPGFTYHNTVVYTNMGTTPVGTGTVSFTKDAAVTITNVSEAGTISNATGFDYTFTNLQPFETRTITVTMQVPVIPTVTLGQMIESSASIAPLTGDINTANNTSVSAQEVIGSYDPNDKMESRGERIFINEFSNNDYLYYTIRFQNTGTASAEFVRIQDVMDSQLDYSTVEMIRASHNYSLDRINNILTWTFNNIMLPASNINEPASHGYVYFRVKPRPGYQVGDIIPNGASIFFDFNPAIVTNTVNSEFVAAMSVDDVNQTSFTMYPNPANGTVNLQLANTGDSIKSVRVYDLTGKNILVNDKTGDTYKLLDISGFSAGAYIVEVTTESNFRTVKKLMVK